MLTASLCAHQYSPVLTRTQRLASVLCKRNSDSKLRCNPVNSAAWLNTCTDEGEYEIYVEVAAASLPKETYYEVLRVAMGPAACWDIKREPRTSRRIRDLRASPEPASGRLSATREELQELIAEELGGAMGQIFVDDLMGRKLSAEETLGDKVLLYKTLDAYRQAIKLVFRYYLLHGSVASQIFAAPFLPSLVLPPDRFGRAVVLSCALCPRV